MCWHDTEGEYFVQARCIRNRLWSRTPLCWLNTLHVRVFRKFAEKNSKSQNVCLKFVLIFFLNIQVSYFYFLEDSAKFHRNIPYVLYALKMGVFSKYSEKISKSKNVCWHDTEGEHFVQARCIRKRLWSRTPLCWFNTLHVRVFRKFAEKNSKSQNVCWNLFWFFLNIQKCLVLLLRRQCLIP